MVNRRIHTMKLLIANKAFPGMKKQYLGENFTLIGKIAKQVTYQYNFQGKNVTDESGNKVDLTNNVKTEGGTTIMNPDNTGGTYAGIMIGGAVGGGISLEFGVVRDNFGSANFYFSFGGHSGLGGGVGVSAGVITPTNNQTFSVNDFNGHGNSFSVNVGFISFERGGTRGDGFLDFGNPNLNSRGYTFSAGSQGGHYPGVSIKDISPKLQYK